MQKPRFLMNQRERSRADAQLGSILELRRELERMSPSARASILDDRRMAAQFLQRAAVVDTAALACLALVCIVVAFPGLLGFTLPRGATLILLATLVIPAFRLVNVMDVSQRAYFSVRREIVEILAHGAPESRFSDAP